MAFLMGVPMVPRRLSFGVGSRVDDAWQRVEALREHHGSPSAYPIRAAVGGATDVEAYWTGHTVNSRPFRSAAGSLRYLRWRNVEYPGFAELMDLWGDHRGEVVLDYGCGPGNDVVGFLALGRAERVVGVDVSATSLGLTRRRLALHGVDPRRVDLIKVSDAVPGIPLPAESVDYVFTEGVLHHVSDPEANLAELRRVLRPGGRALVMVYSRESVFLHLFVAYRRQLLEGHHASAPVEDAFAHNTDGENVPISIPYRPADFLAIARRAGFAGVFRGGYFYRHEELRQLARLRGRALADPRLSEEHKEFLRRLAPGPSGMPSIDGLWAGIGGVYELTAEEAH
jgi:SAM-dependent methyltransferase